jgi:hypothetical protein
MGIKQKITCDVCGTEKVEVNHWFQVFSHISNDTNSEFIVLPCDGEVRDNQVVACGEACAHKLLNQWFDQQRKPQLKNVDTVL